MTMLPNKAILAIAAIVDIAVYARKCPVSAKALASRHNLPPRHLEPLLQALVHQHLLRGIRGPGGGYALGRDSQDITINDIVRAVETVSADSVEHQIASRLIREAILPALSAAEKSASKELAKVRVTDMVRTADEIGWDRSN